MLPNLIYVGESGPGGPSLEWFTRTQTRANTVNGPVADLDDDDQVPNKNYNTNYGIIASAPVSVMLSDTDGPKVVCAWSNHVTLLSDDGTTISNNGWVLNDTGDLIHHNLVKISNNEAVYISYSYNNVSINGSTSYCKARRITLLGSSLSLGSVQTLRTTGAGPPTFDNQSIPNVGVVIDKIGVAHLGVVSGRDYFLFHWTAGSNCNFQIATDIHLSTWSAGPPYASSAIFGTTLVNSGLAIKGIDPATFHVIAANAGTNPTALMQYAEVGAFLVITPVGSPFALTGFLNGNRASEIGNIGQYFMPFGATRLWTLTHDEMTGYTTADFKTGGLSTTPGTTFRHISSGPGSYTFANRQGDERHHVVTVDNNGSKEDVLHMDLSASSFCRRINLSTGLITNGPSINEDSAGTINSHRVVFPNLFDVSSQAIKVSDDRIYYIYTTALPSDEIGIRGKVINK